MLAIRRSEDEKLLSKLSYHDVLTSFYNRNRYIQDVNGLTGQSVPVGVIYLDVNGLKEVNDHFGHAAGDRVLTRCAQTIRRICKKGSFYRIGGDEFVIIYTGIGKTKFYEILGEEYILLAFQYAHEADPDAELYYNDYSMTQPGRREAVVKMVNDLKKRGIRIDAIGMQGHIGMDYPKISEFEKSMLAFAGTGVKIMITELDLTVIPSPNPNVGAEVSASFEYKKEMNPYPDGLPEEVSKAWTERMNDFFRLFLKHHNLITRVTLWGVADQNSWRNDWPMRGRTDYPLLFDRNYQPKPVVDLIIKEAEKTK